MKTSIAWVLLALTGSLLLSACYGKYYITTRPAEPYYAKPASPFDGAVWVPGEWVWTSGRYAYINGHWEKPRPRHIYVPGKWQQGPRGYVWIKGYWK